MLSPYLHLLRPVNILLVVVAVLVGASAAGAELGAGRIWRVAVAAALVAAAGYLVNDLVDVERDRKNKPRRPLPAGVVGRRGVMALAAILGLSGWVLSWTGGLPAGVVVTSWVGLLALYETAAKGTVLWGNLLVSGVAASAFLLGGLAAQWAAPALIPALFAFLFHLGRELWKDAADVEGDRETGTRTLAVARGPRAALRAGCSVFALVVALTPVPYLTGAFNLAYLIVVLVGVDLLLVGLGATVLLDPTPARAARAEAALKYGMAAGLCALGLGPL